MRGEGNWRELHDGVIDCTVSDCEGHMDNGERQFLQLKLAFFIFLWKVCPEVGRFALLAFI